MIGKIEHVSLRSIWKHEATDFTVWLNENIDVLNESLGLTIQNTEREVSTGSFNVDIKAEDTEGNTVIIENQLEKSDHDHLGKLITYLSNFEAKTAIWIVSEPRQEHITAINWLNEGDNGCDFFLLKIEGIKIGDSAPAPLITKIVGPSEETKAVGKIKQNDTERHKLRYKFWSLFLETAKQKTKLFNSISPGKYSYIGTSAGVRGIGYNCSITKDSISIELYIDKGRDSERWNADIFDQLFEKKDEIESKFGSSLLWEKMENRRYCAIRKQYDIGGYRNGEREWDQIHKKAIDELVSLESASRDIIKKLNVNKF